MGKDTDRENRRTLRTIVRTAVSVMIFGCALILASLIIPPPGEIHNSVLVAFGEISTFAGALLGVVKINNRKPTITYCENEKTND